MKLIIQIPCYNEAAVLPITLQNLPRQLSGIDQVELLVIDDGSTDDSAAIAKANGADHIIRLSIHKGLAASFMAGLEACLIRGADIIVNTDADNQYNADDIRQLIDPILDGNADIVVGDRNVATLRYFSTPKRLLQRFGSWIIALASGTPTPDATSGFRAFSREAALRTIVLSDYTYTLETLIQAGSHRMAVAYVSIRTNPQTRPSRLMRNIPHYILNSTATIARTYTMYRPLRVFSLIGGLIIFVGFVLGVRFIVMNYILGEGTGLIQSVILSGVLLMVGFQVLLIGLLADLIGFNRKILEELLYRIRRIELDQVDKKDK